MSSWDEERRERSILLLLVLLLLVLLLGVIDEQSPFVADARKRIKIEEAVYNHAGMPHYPGPFAWFIPPGGVGGGKGAGDCATGLVTTPADLSVKFRHPQLTVHNLVVSSAAPIPMAHLGRSLPTLVGPTKSSFEKFSDKFSPNVALYSLSSLKSEQRSPTPKAAQNAGGDAQQRPLSRIGEMSAPIPVPGSAARERLHHHSSVQSTSAHAPDRQRGSFLSDSEDAAPVVASAMASKSVEAEDEDDGHSSSSNSTLSTDFVRESAILAVDEEELSNILARTDPETRTRVVREVKRIKHRNEAALRQARQEKVKVEEELKQYKTIATNQTTEIQDLKAAKEKLEVENGRLQVKFSKRWSFSQHEPSSST
ncbi:hypothetical protein BV898_17115 [Hypsibius exemplaris]|uniref:BZIP domain-containing protein n=1 Tax=Hypsibius exemplaris TaxID=2072580 RepID=A0A9X6RLU4_HYPEX|nr:hypothetical protein BV898_17115 [Hypsibius exemplaris]